jgi:hypothetical protein
MMRCLLAVILTALLLPSSLSAAPEAPFPDFDKTIRPLLTRHCVPCHGPTVQKGRLRLDNLSGDMADEKSRSRWVEVRQRVQAGEMPPASKPRLPTDDKHALVRWIDSSVQAVDSGRRQKDGRVRLRRLNRGEYQNTLRDLLGVEVEVKSLLPEDSSAQGFDNVDSALRLSAVLLESYLEAGEVALRAALPERPSPQPGGKRFSYLDEEPPRNNKTIFRCLPDAVVFFSAGYSPTHLGCFRAPFPGKYRFRVSASGYQSAGKPVSFKINAGDLIGREGLSFLVGYYDAPADKPAITEFTAELQKGGTIQIVPYGIGEEVFRIGAATYKGPGLAVQWVDIEGPLWNGWPTVSQKRLLGSLPLRPVPGDPQRFEVVSTQPLADAERVLTTLVGRAYRRPTRPEEVQPYVALVRKQLQQGESFDRALRTGILAVLTSPDFLFHREKPGSLDDHALASRLSYFLWSSIPDEELLTLAGQGKLHESETLRRQVERLLKDQRANAFLTNFVGQWLGLRLLDFTSPDNTLYPEFDELLKLTMGQETEKFFQEVLDRDLSLTNFIHSDWTFLNERLARHYGIPGVDGVTLRRVTLPPGSHRGGVLTHASVLKVTANGTTTSPVQRGVWILNNFLGQSPSPPPAGVPAIEPDLRGAHSIREQLARHRESPACASCHARIDPFGFALESYDVIGGWRTWYRTFEGQRVVAEVNATAVRYRRGPAVDPADTLPDGRRFRDIDELKQHLLADRDQLARCLADKLLTYATGHATEPADRRELDAVVERLGRKGYGLRTLIHEIVQSPLFLHK